MTTQKEAPKTRVNSLKNPSVSRRYCRDCQRRDSDGQKQRYFEGIVFKIVDGEGKQEILDVAVTGVPDVPSTGNYKQDSNHSIGIEKQYTIPGTSGTAGTKIHCFDCGEPLGHHDVYSFGGNRFCRKCRLKLEPKKKKWSCPKQSKFAENDEKPFCTITGTIIGNPEQCSPDCDLLQEAS